MRTITIYNAEDYLPYINKVTYTLQSHVKKGIVVTVYINDTTCQIFFWDSWRNFKKWVK